ncbi:MAG TPA: glycosyltransferase family 87 protein [Candidatus Binatia bacterium]|nr:glycosyltransferase family 87 protein [Candidatus Binatia bacterium]
MLAALIDKKKSPFLEDDLGMVARHARVGDDQVFIDLASYTKRSAVEHNIALLIALHQNQCREDSRASGLRGKNRIQNHGQSRGAGRAQPQIRIMTGIAAARKWVYERLGWRFRFAFDRLRGVGPANPIHGRSKSPIFAILFCAFLAAFAGFLAERWLPLLSGSDFPDFYCAARMVSQGRGHQLYDPAVQRQFQARYAGRVGTLYIHPPFEALLYLPVSLLPLRLAYLLWLLGDLCFLALAMNRLAKESLPGWDWRLLTGAGLMFVPTLLCLQQGQDSLFLLLSITLAFSHLRRNRAFTAGCWLGLALCKFQIGLPLILVLALGIRGKLRRALLGGLGVVAFALAAISVALCGWNVFGAYVSLLIHLPAQSFAGVFPAVMANFRGLGWLLFRGNSAAMLVTDISLSALTLAASVVAWRRIRMSENLAAEGFDRVFAASVVFAVLASYHLNPHDLSLLWLPLALLSRKIMGEAREKWDWPVMALLIALFLPPVHLWALDRRLYGWLAIPILLIFWAMLRLGWRGRESI